MYLEDTSESPFAYCVDSYSDENFVLDLPVHQPDKLHDEPIEDTIVVVFAVGNSALREIMSVLIKFGYRYGENFVLFSDYRLEDFKKKFQKSLGWEPRNHIYRFARANYLNSVKPVHTTVFGAYTFLECLSQSSALAGDIAEVGSFEGGNAYGALSFSAALNSTDKTFYIFDSFEGFPELSEHDPDSSKMGDYSTQTITEEIIDSLRLHPTAQVIKGFVPKTFSSLPEDNRYSLVFYDCDLYEPALSTFQYFWERLTPGGFLIVHDYMAEPGGFEGVKKATHEFFDPMGVEIKVFYESTMAILQK
jgi:hypothetical protein